MKKKLSLGLLALALAAPATDALAKPGHGHGHGRGRGHGRDHAQVHRMFRDLDYRTRASATGRFHVFDGNRDGFVTFREWRGNRRSFAVHDRNGDGVLSRWELR